MANKNKKIVRESIGRELVGAGNFESRSNVVKKIISKFPTPQSLSAHFKQLAAATANPAAAQKLKELAVAAAACSPETYPQFVKKIAGFSKLWGIVGATAGAVGATAAALWVGSAYKRSAEQSQNQIDDMEFENPPHWESDSDNPTGHLVGGVSPWQKFKIRAANTGKVMKGDVDKVSSDIKQWGIDHAPTAGIHNWLIGNPSRVLSDKEMAAAHNKAMQAKINRDFKKQWDSFDTNQQSKYYSDLDGV